MQISELKDHFEVDEYVVVEPEAELEESELPFGPYKSATKEEILAAVPPRQIVDKWLVKYFNDEVSPGIKTLLYL